MTVAAVLLGVVAGALVAWILLHHLVEAWAVRRFERWREEESAAIRDESLSRSRAALRGRALEQLAPITAAFPFDPADARFIGTPVDFVVFDGYRAVRAGRADSLTRIVLVDIKTGRSSLSTIQRRVRDCVANGRYWWHRMGGGNCSSHHEGGARVG